MEPWRSPLSTSAGMTNEEYLKYYRIDGLLCKIVRQLVAQKPQNPYLFVSRYLAGTADEGEESLDVSESLDLLTMCTSAELHHEETRKHFSEGNLSLLHQLICNINEACAKLGHSPSNAQAERWGVLVYEAMMGPRRMFHTAQHAIDVGGDGSQPIEVLAGAFHDVVYVQVDNGFPSQIRSYLEKFVTESPPGKWTLTEETAKDPLCGMVLRIFNQAPGNSIKPFGGLNELLSALTVAVEMGSVLSKKDIAQIATCIEGTIPFRPPNHFDELSKRLTSVNGECSIGFDPVEIENTLHMAVSMANRDVENFSMKDTGQFLDNTWELMPEGSPALSSPNTYTIRDFRIALSKMEGFLSRLNPMNVFHSFKGTPNAQVINGLVQSVQTNLGLSVAYLRVKILTMGLFEAIAEATGGTDVPIVLFMGCPPGCGPDTPRLHYYLPEIVNLSTDINPVVDRLLATGRYSETPSFDLKASPVSAFVYRHLGSSQTLVAVDRAKGYFTGEVKASDFLDMCDPYLVRVIAHAASKVVHTRSDALQAIAEKFAARMLH